MISSMTGYGRGEAGDKNIAAIAEVRSVNSRFLEVSTRLPRSLSLRENDIKELLKKKITRGKLNVVVTLEHGGNGELPLKINASAARASYKLLTELRKAVKIKDKITLDHLLKFSEVLEPQEIQDDNEREWIIAQKALAGAIEQLAQMRFNEGKELMKDFTQRLATMSRLVDEIETLSKERIPAERLRLRERVAQLLEDPSIIKDDRLELEIALLTEKLDVTEECVRFRSHTKFFLDALKNEEAAGRKLNFLLQEMNRESNTIGAKSYDAEIAHKVVAVKEELEKVREQLQNIE